jgi:hypothetical protein
MPITIRPIELGEGAEARFWAKVDKSGECWLWTGALTAAGYGSFWTGGAKVFALAHRVAVLLTTGELPLHLEVDHLCRVRRCVRPDHLELVKHQTNVLRGTAPGAMNARKTHCQNGHEFQPETTYVPPSRPNARYCMLCPNWLERHQRCTARRRLRRAA